MSKPTPTPRTYAAKIKSGFAAIPDGFYDHARGLETELTALTAERDQLRAELERLKRDYDYDYAQKYLHEVRERCQSWKQRAERAEAELAIERARLDWFHEAAGDSIWVASQDIRAAIDAAMKEDEK